MQFPMIMGGVVPVVSLPDIGANQLRLSKDVLADIYLGKITKWNDKHIADANKGQPLQWPGNGQRAGVCPDAGHSGQAC